ncbi:MAG: hypothetical protein ACUVTL_04055 [Thermoproteota archaeon]
MSHAGKVLFVVGLSTSILALLLPWNGVDWKLYVIKKWTIASFGLILVLAGAFLIYRAISAEHKGNAFQTSLKYISFSGAIISITMIFFSSWYQVIILIFGVALNMLVLLSTLRDRDFSKFSLLLLSTLLWISFISIIIWNFLETFLPNFFI